VDHIATIGFYYGWKTLLDVLMRWSWILSQDQ